MYFDIDSNIRDNEELTMIKNELHRFARDVIRPAAMKLDQMSPREVAAPDSPYFDVMKKIKQMGYHRMLVPEEYGGAMMSPDIFNIFFEEIAWGSVGFATAIGVDMIPTCVMGLVGSPELREEVLVPWMKDEEDNYRGCWSLTDPDRGSDNIIVMTHPNPEELGIKGFLIARPDGDEWVINGVKSYWTSSAPCANWALIHPLIPPHRGPHDMGLAVVPLTLPGVSVGPPIDKLGTRDDPQGEIVFDNVRIPEHYMICSDSYISRQLLKCIIANTSCAVASMFVGVARAAFEEAWAYCRQRVQGGKPIIEHQLTKYRLYRMYEKIEVTRQFVRAVTKHVWERVLELQTFDQSTSHALMAQAFAKENAFQIASEALQLFGASGITKEMVIEKIFRDARCGMILDGTCEILGLTAIEDLLDDDRYTLDF